MKRTHPKRRTSLLISVMLLPGLAGCFPENYWGSTATNMSVALVDSIIAVATAPIFDALAEAAGLEDADDTNGTGG